MAQIDEREWPTCASSVTRTRGRLGVTAIADSPEAADRLYQRFTAVLDEEARRALEPS
jgi:hypothetical protein